MAVAQSPVITDNLFQEAVSCPLKLYHYERKSAERERTALPFRQRNKLRVRDAAARQFGNVKFTSDRREKAAEETRRWLMEEEAIICGAVIEADECLTRIPILLKKQNHYTVIQVHGKLHKRSQPVRMDGPPKSRSEAVYLQKAAWRVFVLNRKIPGCTFDVRLYFPKRSFRASEEGLFFLADQEHAALSESTRSDLENLFVSVDATEGVRYVLASIPEQTSESSFRSLSVKEAFRAICKNRELSGVNPFGVAIHGECAHCEFRLQHEVREPGCWKTFFPFTEGLHEDRHIFDLIGHGNSADNQVGMYRQEELSIKDGLDSFDIIRQQTKSAISVQARRNLQILKSREEKVPKVWMTSAVHELEELQYPLHFIDFEAATPVLPMSLAGQPYERAYFQFSCHSLDRAGNLTHSTWLDAGDAPDNPNAAFVRALGEIPGIESGTLVQYSPFESQTVKNLLKRFREREAEYETEISILRNIKTPDGRGKGRRFFDLSKMIREAYYNFYLEGSLGLKHVLWSILTWEKQISGNDIYIPDSAFPGSKPGRAGYPFQSADLYRHIQHPDVHIENGEDAMHAYLSLKSNRVSALEKKVIPELLTQYCALDSYALFVIFKHLGRLRRKMKNREQDLVLY